VWQTTDILDPTERLSDIDRQEYRCANRHSGRQKTDEYTADAHSKRERLTDRKTARYKDRETDMRTFLQR
jgi:hypothetical protein